MNVLSLFDGMSCGQIALKTLGIKVDNYFASEVDKYAIQVTQLNFPNTIGLGSVTNIDGSALPKIDLLCGGSPCQSFSFAGKMKGMVTKCAVEILTLEHYLQLKEGGYQFEGQSYLFWEFVRLLKEVKPKYFLLENVLMNAKWQAIITEAIGVEPIKINSALVSAQQRKRLYWTNIAIEYDPIIEYSFSTIPQPEDTGALLKDVLESDVPEKYFLSAKMINYFKTRAANFNSGKVNIRSREGKATTLTASMSHCDISDNFIKIDTNLQLSKTQDKANCFTAGGHSGGLHSDMTLIAASVQKDNLVLTISEATKKGFIEVSPGECFDFENPNSKTRRGRKMPDKSNRLMAKETDFMQYTTDYKIRRLTPTECKRLQTVPDWYDMSSLSDTQRYRLLGNGWTVDVIAHILKHIKS